MKVSVKFAGRRVGALGLTDWIGSFEGSGETVEQAIDAARMAAYDAGYEHIEPQLKAKPSRRTIDGWVTEFEIVYTVIPDDLPAPTGREVTLEEAKESYAATRFEVQQ